MSAKINAAAESICSGDRISDSKRLEAKRCLTSAVKCQSHLIRCLKTECSDKSVRRQARKNCSETLWSLHADAAPRCKDMCHARVKGLRNTTLSLQNQLKSSQSQGKVETPLGLTQVEEDRWNTCMQECQIQQARDSLIYKKCVSDQSLVTVKECAKEKCSASAFACMMKNCSMELEGVNNRQNMD
mmetsp:Transcript_3451/g.4132  ORF Transcript_3451/g.4132 Transcript_3451/m.4132 type:complete len:186 (-) Transcript_3451:1841-2398(-)